MRASAIGKICSVLLCTTDHTMPVMYMFSYLILTMTRWEKYYMHVCFVNEDSKALWAVMEHAWGSSCIRWSSENLTPVLPDRKACASELLLYTISVPGTNKYSIPTDSFSFVWRYQLLWFHHGCSSHLLSHDHQYRAGAKSYLWMTSLRALGSQWITSHMSLEEDDFHISLVTLGQAGCKQKLHKPEALIGWQCLKVQWPSFPVSWRLQFPHRNLL